jgi:hypothetical protein
MELVAESTLTNRFLAFQMQVSVLAEDGSLNKKTSLIFQQTTKVRRAQTTKIKGLKNDNAPTIK